jgi:chemotaxis protein CheD
MDNLIKVGMADLNASCHPSILTTLGLGSCVGVALYDQKTHDAHFDKYILSNPPSVQNKISSVSLLTLYNPSIKIHYQNCR